MTVTTFDPTSADNQAQPIGMTEAAAKHVKGQLATTGARGLRLAVTESGCNGYMYSLDYLDQPSPDDRAIDVGNDLQVHIRDSDLPLLQGTEIDLVIDGLNRSLRFNNPNADGHCGCGESFSIASDASSGA